MGSRQFFPARVLTGAGTSTQTLTNLGSATIPPTGNNWQTYDVDALPRHRKEISHKFTGAGQATVRITSGGGANITYFMLITANTNLPIISQSIQMVQIVPVHQQFTFTRKLPAGH